jgi:hypothetical protein
MGTANRSHPVLERAVEHKVQHTVHKTVLAKLECESQSVYFLSRMLLENTIGEIKKTAICLCA